MIHTSFVSLAGCRSMDVSVASGTIPAPDPMRHRPSRVRTWSIEIARLVFLVFLGFLFVLFAFQDRIIFPGASTQGTLAATVRPRPGTELVVLPTKHGEQVAALFGPALTPEGKPDLQASTRPALIYFYGNAMCLAYAEPELDRFRRLGLNVIIPDYVGYGMSEGRPSEKGCQATADAAYDYLVSTRGIHRGHVISAGWSLGGAVAIDLASRRKVAGLMAFSTFTSGVDMARRILPFVPVSLLLRHRFDNQRKISKVQCPTLIGHGRDDRLIPFTMGERLAKAAAGPVTTLWIDRAEHNDFFDVGGRRIDEAIAKFVPELATAPGE
jgi:fermentation-respiration switch protein FrsA (DUF1100 family)